MANFVGKMLEIHLDDVLSRNPRQRLEDIQIRVVGNNDSVNPCELDLESRVVMVLLSQCRRAKRASKVCVMPRATTMCLLVVRFNEDVGYYVLYHRTSSIRAPNLGAVAVLVLS